MKKLSIFCIAILGFVLCLLSCKKFDPIVKDEKTDNAHNGFAFTNTQTITHIRQESPLTDKFKSEYPELAAYGSSPILGNDIDYPFTTLQSVRVEKKSVRAFFDGTYTEITEDLTKREDNPTAIFSDIPINLKEKIVKIIKTNGTQQYFNFYGELIDTYTPTESLNYKAIIDSTWFYLKNPSALGKQKLANMKKRGVKLEWVSAK